MTSGSGEASGSGIDFSVFPFKFHNADHINTGERSGDVAEVFESPRG